MNDPEHYEYYSFPTLCNRTEFNCMDGQFKNYCPNKDESCEDEKQFFCIESKTCIPKGNNDAYIQNTYEISQRINSI